MSEPLPDSNLRRGVSRARIEQGFRANSRLIIATRIVTACLSLAVVPILVSSVGVTGYGTWEALFALASLSSVFQVAVAGTLVWRTSEAYGFDDAVEIRRVARLGAGATWTLFVLLWPLAWFLRDPVVHFLGVPPGIRQQAAGMFPMVTALVLLNGLCETLEAVVSGCQRAGVVGVVGALAQIVNYSVVIGMTIVGGGLWSLVAGQAAGFVARFAGAWVATRLCFGAVSLLPIVPRRNDLSMARYSGLVTVSSVAAALRDQTDKIILASLASPAWVGYYGMATRLSGLVMEILRPFYAPLLTAAGALKAMGDWDGVRVLYGRAMTIVSILTGVLVVVVAGLADHLVVLWIGYPIPQVTTLLWLLITGTATAAILTGPGTAISRGCGQAGIEATYLAVNLALNLTLTVALVLLIGPMGTAVATGSTWALSSILFLLILHAKLDLPVAASRRAVWILLLAVVAAVAAYWTSRSIGLPTTRNDAFVSVTLLSAFGGLLYLALIVSAGLLSVGDACRRVRSLLWNAG